MVVVVVAGAVNVLVARNVNVGLFALLFDFDGGNLLGLAFDWLNNQGEAPDLSFLVFGYLDEIHFAIRVEIEIVDAAFFIELGLEILSSLDGLDQFPNGLEIQTIRGIDVGGYMHVSVLVASISAGDHQSQAEREHADLIP